ncbi:MAG TPA: serine hydrolase domain-containing protein [Vicinamibacterales bacterium]|nr:serine hydrolase domain-containing protein [Vicinamibacterales bacterium]
MFTSARAVLEEARATSAFPAAVCEVGHAGGPVWTEAFGHLTYASDSEETSTATPFDLASLTKVIATSSIAMSLMRSGMLRTDTAVSDVLTDWRGTDRESVTVGHLLDHSSGLPAHLRFPSTVATKEEAREWLLTVPLERLVGAASVYSDVGFMLLGFLLETVAGRSLDTHWDRLWESRPDARNSMVSLGYKPDAAERHLIAPTEFDAARGGLIQGTVHDENAATLGGVAAHAGLFGTASAVGVFAAWVLRSFRETTWLTSPELMQTFATRRQVPGSSRALGWDTMLPSSSCGTRMSPTAIGHTGFTGTSLWIDWERDRYVVLLTNRVYPTRDNERFLPYRSKFHDAVAEDLSGTRN